MPAREISAAAKRRAAFQEAEKRRKDVVDSVTRGLTLQEAADNVGIGLSTIRQWVKRYPEYARDLALARQSMRGATKTYDGTFISFRLAYLGMKTTPFQAKIVEKIEQAKPGEVTMVLIPPEHGKTTLLEDWCTYKLVTDPSFRITVASETVNHGVKMIERVRHRLEPDGPTPNISRDFGPIAPEGQDRSQIWGSKQFDVAQKRQSDERDYSMHAVGITGRVQGTRCDLLLLDDIQDVKSLDLSQKYFEIITQSFLSRPSMFGRTVIIGTRVGEFDVYRLLMDAQIDDHLVKIAAYDEASSPEWTRPLTKPVQDDPTTWAPEGTKFLWPDKYDDIPGDGLHRYRYAFLRYRIGEQAWARNYMQHPEAAASMTFDQETTEQMKDSNRSVITPVAQTPTLVDGTGRTEWGPTPVVITLDPAIGSVNAVLSAAMYSNRLEVLHVRRDVGLTKYSQIFDVLEEECHRYSTDRSFVATIVIEDKAFQRGILRDDRLVEMEKRFGFRVVPNTTGREKVDPDIGVPSIPLAMWRGEVTIPWADEPSRKAMEPLLEDLHRWRPGIPGTKLPQDHTMTLWFAVRQWRAVRDTPVHRRPDLSTFAGRPSPMRKPRPRRVTPRTTYRRLGTIPGRGR